ncbi:MAG: DinB family protein [Bacteroidota bacterium]
MKEYFQKLYRYNEWANRRVLGAIERQNVSTEKILSIFSHQLSANFLWLHRIKGLPPPDVELWKTYPIDRLRKMVDDGSKQWLEYIDSTDNFNRVLKYKNYVGDYYESNVEHIMMHLVNHGSYHRGQVALLLRQNGFEPINTDFITYDRVITGQWKE